MKWLIIALIIIIILLVTFILTKLTVILDYYHGNDNDHLKLEFKIWFGIIKYKKEIPMIKIDDNSPTIVVKEKTKKGRDEKTSKEEEKQIDKKDILNYLHNTKELLNHVVKLHNISKSFFSKVSVRRLEWHTVIGVGDAAYTAVATGGIWAVKGSILGIISHNMKLKEMPRMTVTPYFQYKVSQTRIRCMIQFRIGQAMLAGLKLIKFWKGGRPDFKSKSKSVLSQKKPKSV
ncbi:DUF2953 domain-containing protein [Pseudoneobacillus rhizosphaerae]|uniref:DUF2953 domain-containing protein n=1 Tax=Pseudoneobacillus rhizosphaerae TaxID=2880968 RepID=A0A9C7GAH5_9BACI|nr:DUF2953 domain-containing protein [Pseudoneobacillus rhizosphaerae]CAG9608904.1 hypothetical protein NEOCIP111885_02622 [Pseudoneobacillus rhizosphaerae]